MIPDQPLALLDFAEAHAADPDTALIAVTALLLDPRACATRVEFLRALERGDAGQTPRPAAIPVDQVEAALRLIDELGIAQALRTSRLGVPVLDALTRSPDGLVRLHQAITSSPGKHAPGVRMKGARMFVKNDLVHHPRFGSGRVRLSDGETTIVRFETDVEECLTAELTLLTPPDATLVQGQSAPPAEVVARLQAEAIRSVSESWGVLSRSRIDLLPHQLWVCKKVLERWPTRWLVADDVGLGKTIEAGLILMPLLASGRVKRLLIICPAGLVDQWGQRLHDLFGIHTQVYSPDSDREGRNYWGPPALQVVASLQTLRLNSDEDGASTSAYRRWDRLLAAEPWDLVLVDEAHHLNSDEEDAATHGYRLLKKMQEAKRIRSLVFFTGTPHRGKDYNFLAILNLLQPELFNPERPMSEQLANLPKAVIRNNKQTVTDLEGKLLFFPPVVRFERYSYSREEARFYELLTQFITSGQAYASHLADRERRAVILVLIALQKLASSSVAAIRAALRGRLARIRQQREALGQSRKAAPVSLEEYDRGLAAGEDDSTNTLTERVDEMAVRLRLMENEEARLAELLAAADEVKRETKIDRILDLIDGPFAKRQVLLFTEYKATQAAVLEAISARHGSGCAAFINGDDALPAWTDGGRRAPAQWTLPRSEAADGFNAGKTRFLVSTEAGGEGIDLQERCHSLIHVDLPWNPMRLHQRVGRLNRYGQTKPVEVYSLRNEETVEALIWHHLEEKLEQITRALGRVMDDPEDMKQLVLGMASPSLFQTLFADAPRDSASIKSWFDSQTATLGGQDMIRAVRDLVGHCERFDFGKAAPQVPRVDLPDLSPFLVAMLELNKRRVTKTPEGLTFKTPEAWEDEPGVRASYEKMTFDRRAAGRDAQRVLGVGHKVVDLAVAQARAFTGRLAFVPATQLPAPLFVFRLSDRATGTSATLRGYVAGVEDRPEGPALLRDWELLQRLNGLGIGRSAPAGGPPGEAGAARLADAEAFVRGAIPTLDLPYQVPQAEPIAVLWPTDG